MKTMTDLETLRHSAAHVLATAVLRLFPEAKLDIGPPTENGFYYDFDLEHNLTAEDLEKIEAEMKKVAKENQRFERAECTREEAEAKIKASGQSLYKLGRLADVPEGETISFFTNGEFSDLCAGPHVGFTSKLKAVKLLHVAGAYHRGDSNEKQLQRIYGTAFPTKAELAEHLEQLEQAKLRDHRKIGKEMELFQIDEQVGQGLVLWAPKGAAMRGELERFISGELLKQGYDTVYTPHIGKLELYRTSGHFPYYKESQFAPLVEPDTLHKAAEAGCSCAELSNQLDEGELSGYLLKPMNCPMHIRIYQSRRRSYKELPLRLAEFGTVYRWEQSGELNGLTRVRGFTQDDAHLFCTPDQVQAEINQCLELVKTVLGTMGMSDFRVRVGLRDPDGTKYTGKPELWDAAENILREAAGTLGVPFTEEPGEAAFYGPKIDFVVRDCIGREWQLGTVQLDYNLPERFGLEYIGADNTPHRPVMVHRAPFGSLERFTGVLIEHFAGNFPAWLAPEQIRIVPMNDDLVEDAKAIELQLKAAGYRVSMDTVSDKLGAKIRRAETDRVPYICVLGKKEKEEGTINVRSRVRKSAEGSHTVEAFMAHLAEEVEGRKLPDIFNA